MKYVLAESSEEVKDIEKLLSKDIPTYRQAYSDRTAWVMACLSDLVYIKFNEPLIDVENKSYQKLQKSVTELVGENNAKSLSRLIDLLAYDHEEERKKLASNLDLMSIKIEVTFDSNGTQAMLVSNDKYYALVFRGTEATSKKDIKSDLNGIIKKCKSGGKIHTGFSKAFAEVHVDIQNYLNDLSDEKPLFITGHSLGGALATVATKKLTHRFGIAACYTYGSPRVGNEDWMDGIKTPIYRLVNSADPVTMLPFGDETLNIVTFPLKLIPRYGDAIRDYLMKNFGGYYHAGDMRYLTNVGTGDYKDAKVLYHVSFLRRIRAYILKVIPFTKIPSDHSISVYRQKLKHIATDRNRE